MALIRIHDLETGEIIDREMNAEELANNEEVKARWQREQEEIAEKKAAREALLAKLGITEEESKFLIP